MEPLQQYLIRRSIESTISFFKPLVYLTLILFVIIHILQWKIDTKFKPNQIWVWEYISDNPYNRYSFSDTINIIGVQNGFTQYKHNGIVTSKANKDLMREMGGFYKNITN